MARLEMDFAARESWPRLVLVLLALGLAGSLYAIWLRDDLLTQRDARQDEIRRLERSLSHHQFFGTSSTRQNPKAVAETRRLVMELQRPWEAMLNSLQKAARPDMLIVRIQPESNANRLLISGQADDNEAFLSYVTRLRDDAAWRSVEPVSEERGAAVFVQGSKPVSFQLVAEWGAP
ncbi:MAG: hypothetical protein PSX71_03640 [bacterium]|nr:hypothetical protein [bacterium]